MFIYCKDNTIKNKLLSQGYQLLKEQNGMFVFADNKKLVFDDSLKNKVVFSNRMTF